MARTLRVLAEELENRTHLTVAAPALVVATESTIIEIASGGARTTIASSIDSVRGVEVLGSTIYAANTGDTAILGFNESGTQVSSTPVPAGVLAFVGFSALADGRFALFDNVNDNVYFIDASGTLLHTTAIKSPADAQYQVMSGVEVGNQLIVSNDGDDNIIAFDLTSYAASTFKAISTAQPWIGAIDVSGDNYYLCTSQELLTFTQAGTVSTVATFTSGNLTAVVTKDGFGYVSHNGDNAIYRVDLSTGDAAQLYTNVTNPSDVELAPLPVVTSPLVISGTGDNDVILLTQSGDDLAVTVNGSTTHHSVSAISSLTINGLAGDDSITLDGSIAALITGGDGNDTLIGGGGNDTIYGNWGDDSILGGAGDDEIRGGLGNDTIFGNEGYDAIYGGQGNDQAHGNQDDDQVFGKAGSDTLFGGIGNDYVCGMEDDDVIYGRAGDDTIYGNDGNDSVYGDDGNDELHVLDEPMFADFGDGGTGENTATFDELDTILNCTELVPV